MDEMEALGDAVTGGVIAHAVGPRTGEDGHTHEGNCLNCGAALQGAYCHRCGQHAHIHRTLGAFFHDLVHGVLHFEGKIWRTLPLLVWRPGELTRRYIDGQRARFVSPIALFLFCVFLMFGVIGLTGHSIDTVKVRADATRSLEKDQVKLNALESRRQAALKTGQSTAKLDERIGDLKGEMTALQALRDGKIDPTTFKFQNDYLDELNPLLGKASKNPELLFYKVKTNAYKFSWALIPISVPFVWLLFPFSRRFRLYDHTVFVTYSLCFMMLLLSASTIIGLVSSSLESLAWLVPPFHMYRQLRGTYGVGKWSGIWRAAALSIFAFMAIGLFASLLLGVGAFD